MDLRRNICVLVIFIVCRFDISMANSYQIMTDLISHVLNGYNPDVLPINNQTDSIYVDIGMGLYFIKEVDTVKGMITFVSALYCSWHDERIKWDPTDYAHIKEIAIRQSDVWTPALVFQQANEFKELGEPWMQVIYQSDGYANWFPVGIKELSCNMNLKYWPFDIQVCELTLMPFNQLYRVHVTISPVGLTTLYYAENAEWILEEPNAKITYTYGIREAVFKFSLRRRSLFHVQTLIIPLIAISVIRSFVFMLPSDSGERVSYSITILLAQTVFLMVISDNIPKVSNPIPLLCIAVIADVAMSGIATTAVILNLAIYHRTNDTHVTSSYRYLLYLTNCRKIKKHETYRNGTTEALGVDKNDNRKRENLAEEVADSVTEKYDMVMIRNAYQENINSDITWKDVSFALDKILFVFVIFGTLLPGTIILAIIVNQ